MSAIASKKGFILITRPRERAKILAEKLALKGYKTLIEPFLEVSINDDIDCSEINPDKVVAVLISSGNAVFALSKLNFSNDILVLAVGKKTGEIVRNAGYKNVVCANNSAADLEKLAMQILTIKNGTVVYLSGDKVTLDLAQSLRSKGLDARRIKVYSISYKEKLSKNLIQKISNHEVSEVVIYSLATAKVFCQLILKHNLLEDFDHIKLSCLSKKILDYLVDQGFKNVGLSKIK